MGWRKQCFCPLKKLHTNVEKNKWLNKKSFEDLPVEVIEYECNGS